MTVAVHKRWLVIMVALVAYGFVLVGGFLSIGTGSALSSLALAVLGFILYAYTSVRMGPVDTQPKLGGRAQATQRRYRTIAISSVLSLYLALAAGTIVTNQGALWECLAWPVCAPSNDLAVIAMTHRVLVALATLFIIVFAIQTWRLHTHQSIRQAARWAFGLMIVATVVGMFQVILANQSNTITLAVIRIAHLTLGASMWGILVVMATVAYHLPITKTSAKPVVAKPEDGVVTHTLFKDYVSLTKPRVITLLILTTITTMFITPEGMPSLTLLFWTTLGGWLMPSGAHALNCYFDRDVDLKMGRTGRRPLPSNRIPAWHALVLGIVLAIVAFAILAVFVNLLTAILALTGFFYYVVIYTLILKRNSPSNIVIGGAAGAFPPLVGWAAVTGDLSFAPLFLFAIIFYWTPPHFWALALIRQKDYANANIPMLPVVAGDDETKRQIVLYSILMFVLTLILTPLQIFGLPYFLMALAFGGLFLYYAIQLQREGSTKAAWALYRYSLLYLALLFVAMVVDRVIT